jgi:hypothetical protein
VPTKTERILGYLPGTFRPGPRPSALDAVVGAFGDELEWGENSLVAVMQAHWVDQADRAADQIDDLARLASLYGLAPRPDEDVEEFRAHLKRYVRTFLDGTVTVQGILRVAAEALGLALDEAPGAFDPWWRRHGAGGELVEVEAGPDDAAPLLGLAGASARGRPRTRAEMYGSVELGAGVDLRGRGKLRLRIDGGSVHDVELAAAATDPAAVTPDEIVIAIEAAVGAGAARRESQRLVLSSPTSGAAGSVEVPDGPEDAAEPVLGLPPRAAWGADADAAHLVGEPDLSGGVDLSDERYLRVVVDSTRIAEVDCAGANPAATTLAEIAAAIDAAFGGPVGSNEGGHLALTSPTTGAAGSVGVSRAAAQDAAERLLGGAARFAVGHDDRPARLEGRADLSGGVDLSGSSKLYVSVDDGVAVAVDCAGPDPPRTLPGDVVGALNAALGAPVASHDGRTVTLASTTHGASGSIALVEGPDDGAAPIMGLRPRSAQGNEPEPARLVGEAELTGGVNLFSRNVLRLGVDDAPPVTIDLGTHAADLGQAQPDELVAAIAARLGPGVAGFDGTHLTLVSPTSGVGSALVVETPTLERRRRYVTKAVVADEAARTLLGFVAATATGEDSAPARLVGQVEVRAPDLREKPFLRVTVDEFEPADVDCRGAQPRATALEEVVSAVNAALVQRSPTLADVARAEGHRLVLVSPSTGASSRVVVEPPRAEDALQPLGLASQVARGADPTRVALVGAVDLSAGVDLPAGAALAVGVDAAPPVEVALAAAGPEHHSLPEIVVKVNTALGDAIAGSDGTHLLLTSPTRGAGSRIELAAPAGTDATAALLGFVPPRSYHGADAGPARVLGGRPLPPALDLRTARFLRVGLDVTAPADVDCASRAAAPEAVAPGDVIAALEASLGAGAAALEGGRLVIRSHAVGAAAVVRLEQRPSSNAAEILLGAPEPTAQGLPARPATIDGVADLLLPVDLSRRSVLRLAVDGGPPFDVDVAGPIPHKTILAEVVAALNDAVSGLATATPDDRLRLTSPTAGADSSIAVVPLRALEVVEYPEQEVRSEPQALGHGGVLRLENLGVGDASGLELTLTTEQGVAGPSLLNRGLGLQARALVGLGPGETLRLRRDDGRGLAAEILSAAGPPRRVAPHRLAVGLLGARAPVPFESPWRLAGDEPALQLDDPLEPSLVLLRARLPDPGAREIEVTAAEAAADTSAPAAPADPARIVGRLRRSGDVLELEGADGSVLAECRSAFERVGRLEGRVVAAAGRLEDDTPPILVARSLHAAYDVVIRRSTTAESHAGVTLGTGTAGWDDLTRRIASAGSQLVVATDVEKAGVLELPPGRSEWIFLECLASRYDEADFDHATFADGLCVERGLFDVSRFANAPPETVVAAFAEADVPPAVATGSASWTSHAAGAFVVNLPADLVPRFGGRFDEERYAVGADAAETYEGAVFEPSSHPRYLERLIETAPSKLVHAQYVDVVPLGWDPVSVPFRKPRPLTLGGGTQTARIYLMEPGVPGFVELAAREPGAWGNQIRVAARRTGPARFDVSISFEAGRFESARRTVLGATVPAAAADVLKPGPIGILHAKAAGVHAAVTRDRASGGKPETDD